MSYEHRPIFDEMMRDKEQLERARIDWLALLYFLYGTKDTESFLYWAGYRKREVTQIDVVAETGRLLDTDNADR